MISLRPIINFENIAFLCYNFCHNIATEVNQALFFNFKEVWNIDLLLQTL